MDILRVETAGDVTSVLLNRPEARNALDETLIGELTQAFRSLTGSTRVVVLGGAGPAFCAGGDAHWMRRSKDFSRAENERDAARLAEMLEAVDACPCPVIARVHGAAMGGGAGLVAVSDVAVADEGAQFGFPEVRLGLIPAVISTYVLPSIGPRAARRYFLTGERFSAREALSLGLVHEVCTAAELDHRVAAVAEALRQGGPRALEAAKRLIRETPSRPREKAIEASIRAIAELRVTPEAQEGLSAFIEKRKPRWP